MSRSQALNKLLIVIGLLFILLVTMQTHAQPIHHKMDAEILPALKLIKAHGTIHFPANSARRINFLLHKDLEIAVHSSDDQLVVLQTERNRELFVEYGLILGQADDQVSLSFSGVIYDAVENDESNGLIGLEGATLFGSTYWYPYFLDQQVTFDLTVRTPADWTALSQGKLMSQSQDGDVKIMRYLESLPQEDMYLVAAPFHSYEALTSEGKKVRVLLRKDEPALAQSFLTLVPEYLSHYSQVIGAYPYESFTVVENFWETGYGMPSFTLLGPTVIRLPFLLNSSLPHEVLHNWWGNSVYVDVAGGNWCEGLTSYMADYWQQDKLGLAPDYRLKSLISYDDFVRSAPDKDFPLREFKGRHNSSSQAVGYGKSMMFFQMLEFQLGKNTFQKGLQDFYQRNLFKRASFKELQKSFEAVSSKNLEVFFKQWLDRKGAPELSLDDVRVMRWHDGSYSTSYSLTQKQNSLYTLKIPVSWTLANGEKVMQILDMDQSTQVFSFLSSVRPVKVSVDSEHNIFRHLYEEERPATLSSVLGNAQIHFYLRGDNKQAAQFAQIWSNHAEGKTKLHWLDKNLEPASSGAIVLVGDDSLFEQFIAEQLEDQDFSVDSSQMTINGKVYPFKDHSTVLVTRLKKTSQPIVWVRWSADNNAVEWASRLTHYGSFGILIFKGRPAVEKSSWPVTISPLQREL